MSNIDNLAGNVDTKGVALASETVRPFEPDSPAAPFGLSAQVQRIPVIEESLQVSKRTVERGGYRLTKQVSTVDETVDEALRSQTVNIERRPSGKLLEGLVPPLARHEGDVLVVPIVKEVLVTEKRLMLVEEIWISQVETEYRDPQVVTLRKESILIERLEVDPSK